ncbi:Adenylate Cyclase Type 2 [Manis pentadactyla]|nr:Adenylate Cyclase Type 2 [Manis pentadactyla]
MVAAVLAPADAVSGQEAQVQGVFLSGSTLLVMCFAMFYCKMQSLLRYGLRQVSRWLCPSSPDVMASPWRSLQRALVSTGLMYAAFQSLDAFPICLGPGEAGL